MLRTRSFNVMVGLLLSTLVGSWAPTGALAHDNDPRAVPFVFVGQAGDCGDNYPAGARIVTSAWLGGMGLPDNGGPSVGPNPANNPNKNDLHRGLLLSKNGTTADCSAAGANITRVGGMTVTPTFALGFDYRNGGHCGAGAPRFNVETDMGSFFVGCASAPQTAAPQDPAQWRRTRSVLTTCGAECFPGPIPAGAEITRIRIIFDEGTDTANNDTEGVGLAVIDNIFINGRFIRSGRGIADGPNHEHHDNDDDE